MRKTKVIPSTTGMKKKTSLESAEEGELRWGFRGGLGNENPGHHVTAEEEEEAALTFGMNKF